MKRVYEAINDIQGEVKSTTASSFIGLIKVLAKNDGMISEQHLFYLKETIDICISAGHTDRLTAMNIATWINSVC